MEETVSKDRAKSELCRRRDEEDAASVAKDNDSRRRSQEEEEISSSVRSSVADDILAAADKKTKGVILRAVEETIASVTSKKDRETDEAVERAISECGRGFGRALSEEREKFEAEGAEYMECVVEEAVIVR